MNCRDFTSLASALLDGELADDRRAGAEEHAAECDECARLLEDLAAVDRHVAAEPAPERPGKQWEGFDRSLMVRIAMEERTRLVTARERLRRAWRAGLRATAAAAALIAAALAGYALRGPGTATGDGAATSPAANGNASAAPLPEAANPARDPERELRQLLAASESVLVRLANVDPRDRGELAAIRSLVIDAGLAARLAEARRNASGHGTALAAVRPVEIVLVRVANGSPAESAEFREIRNAILDAALVERAREIRDSL